MPARRPGRCPDCGHRLPEPPGQRCAQCGLPCDEHTRVWRSRKSWQHHGLAYFGTGVLIGLGLAVGYRLAGGHLAQPLLPLLFGLAYACLGLLVRRLLTGRLSRRFAAITPAGVVLGTRRRSRLISWQELERLSQRKGVPELRLRGSAVPVALEDVFDRPEDLAAFGAELEKARRRYCPPAARP